MTAVEELLSLKKKDFTTENLDKLEELNKRMHDEAENSDFLGLSFITVALFDLVILTLKQEKLKGGEE